MHSLFQFFWFFIGPIDYRPNLSGFFLYFKTTWLSYVSPTFVKNCLIILLMANTYSICCSAYRTCTATGPPRIFNAILCQVQLGKFWYYLRQDFEYAWTVAIKKRNLFTWQRICENVPVISNVEWFVCYLSNFVNKSAWIPRIGWSGLAISTYAMFQIWPAAVNILPFAVQRENEKVRLNGP